MNKYEWIWICIGEQTTNPLDFPRLSVSRRQNCTLPKHSNVDHSRRWVVCFHTKHTNHWQHPAITCLHYRTGIWEIIVDTYTNTKLIPNTQCQCWSQPTSLFLDIEVLLIIPNTALAHFTVLTHCSSHYNHSCTGFWLQFWVTNPESSHFGNRARFQLVKSGITSTTRKPCWRKGYVRHRHH